MSMFCYQCQEAAKGIGCTIKGVCGKEPQTSNLQDLLLFVTQGISILSTELRTAGYRNDAVDAFVLDALFCTITNANFDDGAISDRIVNGLQLKRMLFDECKNRTLDTPNTDQVLWEAPREAFADQSLNVGVKSYSENDDIRSLKSLIIYGLKGLAAYAEHAANLDFADEDIHDFLQHALAQTTRTDISTDELVALTLETGKFGVSTMALLDKANTTRYGNPEITKVKTGVRGNPAILISGHDLKDIEELLAQTEGTGVDIYTHSEMLPAHYYPAFKKYTHFVGNYGSSWWHQRDEFETFNGPILFTTNCIVPPLASATYMDRIYTTGSAGLTGAPHIGPRTEGQPKDFSVIVDHAKRCQPPVQIEDGEIIGGFAHEQVFALSDKVVEAINSGTIRKFVVMAGCDGRMKDRQYYTEFAEQLPKDTVILTAGCAKYRYNKLPLGDISGIPRVLDAGQCNDSYSLALIALKLKEVFKLEDVNQLPIAYNIAWYEQKAVIVLLALLYLGVKNIHLGPTLPAFLSPTTAKILVENFGIAGTTTVDADIKRLLA